MDSDFQPPKGAAKSPTEPKLTSKGDENQTFKTPEETAAEEVSETPAQGMPDDDTATPSGPEQSMPRKSKSKWNAFNHLNWPPGKKEWIILLVLVLVIGGAIGGWLLLHKPKPATIQPIPKVTDIKKTVPSTLTGLPVDPSVNKRTVTGVMIENSQQARPQSGLGDAGVVFEAIAEGGITRFLALYQDTAPNNVGPIRSARPYYEQWALGFDAGYAHVGGSPEALADIKAWHVRDLDQFYNARSYHRISSRSAPHNVYTSIATLNQLEVQKGYDTSTYTGFVRKKKAVPTKQAPTAKSININISGPLYDVHYDYNATTNSYDRSEGGAPHMDANTNKQISPTVVMTLAMPYQLESDGYHSKYSTIGSGPAYIFQDGDVISGQWSKKSNTDQFTFTDTTGKTIKLNPGKTWITAVSSLSRVSYSP